MASISAIRVDDTVVKSVSRTDSSYVEINGQTIIENIENPRETLQDIREALKKQDYNYEEFVQDREKTDSRPENGDRYVLTRIYSNGKVEDLNYSNNEKTLRNKLTGEKQ